MFGTGESLVLISCQVASTVLLVMPRAGFAQETLSSVQGVVQNESGLAIEEAQVLLDSRELRTDRDGRFRFIGVTAGSHRLRVLRIGFQPFDTTLTAAGTARLTITLRRLTTLREVEVVSRATGVYGTVLERDSLQPVAGARADFAAEDIESIEVYGSRGEISGTLGKRWPRGAICGNPNARLAPGTRAPLVSIWLRR